MITAPVATSITDAEVARKSVAHSWLASGVIVSEPGACPAGIILTSFVCGYVDFEDTRGSAIGSEHFRAVRRNRPPYSRKSWLPLLMAPTGTLAATPVLLSATKLDVPELGLSSVLPSGLIAIPPTDAIVSISATVWRVATFMTAISGPFTGTYAVVESGENRIAPGD